MILMIPDAISRKHRGMCFRAASAKTIFCSTFLLFCRLALERVDNSSRIVKREKRNAVRAQSVQSVLVISLFPQGRPDCQLAVTSPIGKWSIDRNEIYLCSWYDNLSLWNIFVPRVFNVFNSLEAKLIFWKINYGIRWIQFFKIRWKYFLSKNFRSKVIFIVIRN